MTPEDYARQRERADAVLAKFGSKTHKAFLALKDAAFAPGALDVKTKELIAAGISVVINCEPCMQWHIDKAVAAGATERELIEMLDVTLEMGGGPAGAHGRFALEAMARALQK